MDSLDLLEFWLPKLKGQQYEEENGTIHDAFNDFSKIARDLEMLRIIKPFIRSVVYKDDAFDFFGSLIPSAEYTYTNKRIFNAIEKWLDEPISLLEDLKYDIVEEPITEPHELLEHLYYLAYCNARPNTYGAYKIQYCYELLKDFLNSQIKKEKYKEEKLNMRITKVLDKRTCNIIIRSIYRARNSIYESGVMKKWSREIDPTNVLIGDVIEYSDKFQFARNMGKKTWQYVKDTINDFIGEEVIK